MGEVVRAAIQFATAAGVLKGDEVDGLCFRNLGQEDLEKIAVAVEEAARMMRLGTPS